MEGRVKITVTKNRKRGRGQQRRIWESKSHEKLISFFLRESNVHLSKLVDPPACLTCFLEVTTGTQLWYMIVLFILSIRSPRCGTAFARRKNKASKADFLCSSCLQEGIIEIAILKSKAYIMLEALITGVGTSKILAVLNRTWCFTETA